MTACRYTKIEEEHFSIISTHVDDILQVSDWYPMVDSLPAGLNI
jgi:hypothetical protein